MVSREEGGRLLTVAGRTVVAGDGSVEKAAALAIVRADVVRLDVEVANLYAVKVSQSPCHVLQSKPPIEGGASKHGVYEAEVCTGHDQGDYAATNVPGPQWHHVWVVQLSVDTNLLVSRREIGSHALVGAFPAQETHSENV